jgi:hypothetical protein
MSGATGSALHAQHCLLKCGMFSVACSGPSVQRYMLRLANSALKAQALRDLFSMAYSALYVQHCLFSAACRVACSALLAQQGMSSAACSALHT